MRLSRTVLAGLVVLLGWLFWAPMSAQAQNLVANPGFEEDLSVGWGDSWARDPTALTLERVSPGRTGSYSLKVTHTGAEDWCLDQGAKIPVSRGDIFEISAWIKAEDMGDDAAVNVSVVLYDGNDEVMDWAFGQTGVRADQDWGQVITHFVIPPGCETILLRLEGYGIATAWYDDVSLEKQGNIIDIRGPDREIALENDSVGVVFDTATAAFTITDKRNEETYEPLVTPELPVVMGVTTAASGRMASADLWYPGDDFHLEMTLLIPTAAAEVKCELDSDETLSGDLLYPPPFLTAPGDFLVVPMNEGIIFPVDDDTVEPLWLSGYSGHGICMSWYGLTRGLQGPGIETIIETPDDMNIRIDRTWSGDPPDLMIWPAWEPCRGDFGYTRALTFSLISSGGYVAQAKRYRRYVQEIGRWKSLIQKRAENPNVDLLIGAANVWAPTWYDNNDPLGLVQEMKSLGIERILYSEGSDPDTVAALNDIPGVLTSRYDIYTDVWPPGQPDWANHEGWPEDLILLPDGTPMQGWVIRDGDKEYPGGVICSPRGLEHAQVHIPEDLATTPYRCRFLDVTTAAELHECYNPDHPTTRSEDKYWRQRLLDFCSHDMGMVTGSETGMDWAVPYVDYFEGMLSLGPYRLPDSGYTLIDHVEPTPDFLKYQVGPYYRVPLWELVYHECVVAMWYWGDSSNKEPEVWNQRDLFNVLYGTPPLFMLSPEVWDTHKDRFVQSYQNTCPTARRLGYDEMLSHEFLTEDHTLQQTSWSSGTTVIVNLSDAAQTLPDGASLGPWSFVERGYPFYDILLDHWARAQIVACYDAGIVGGYDDHTYRPTLPVTRDQMAVYVARALCGGDEFVPTGPAEATFPDVPTDHWAYKYVEYAVAANVVQGYDDGTYRPTVEVDRGQMAVYIARALLTPTGDAAIPDPGGTPTFPDVPADYWCYRHVEYLAGRGIVNGYDDGTYRPENVVTRDQMAVYVQRAFELAPP